MHIYTKLESIPRDMKTVLSVGNFDGVHIGHQELIKTVVHRGRQLGATSAIVTFDPHPSLFFHPDVPTRMLTPLPVKLHLLEQLGIEAAIVLPFTQELATKSPQDFVQEILINRLHVEEIHEGSNFRFGNLAQADVHQLVEFGRQFGFCVKIHIPIQYDGERVSSTRIRKVLNDGDIQLASVMLSIEASRGAALFTTDYGEGDLTVASRSFQGSVNTAGATKMELPFSNLRSAA